MSTKNLFIKFVCFIMGSLSLVYSIYLISIVVAHPVVLFNEWHTETDIIYDILVIRLLPLVLAIFYLLFTLPFMRINKFLNIALIVNIILPILGTLFIFIQGPGEVGEAVSSFLPGGELYKYIVIICLVLLTFAGIFKSKNDDVRHGTSLKLGKYFVWGIWVLVLIAIAVSFIITRFIQFDQTKISNLKDIQQNIINYWQSKEKLPEKLSDLEGPTFGFKVPVDPQTKINYEYIIKDFINLSFELCANFNKPSVSSVVGNWSHQAGRFCFNRTIDKQFYPLITKPMEIQK